MTQVAKCLNTSVATQRPRNGPYGDDPGAAFLEGTFERRFSPFKEFTTPWRSQAETVLQYLGFCRKTEVSRAVNAEQRGLPEGSREITTTLALIGVHFFLWRLLL
jgi:hypothetical protein